VLAADLSQETFHRARAELTAQGLIERYQQDARHCWRITIPDHPPTSDPTP